MNDGAGLVYPGNHRQRDQWVVEHRTERSVLDPRRPYAYLLEEECSASGEVVQVSTIFLTNRECPWHCVMCDLWRNTLPAPVPLGAIPEQIDFALARLGSARQVKLYNSGSFFDGGAIPVADYESIASKVNRFDRIIVESHPSLVYGRSLEFRDLLSSPLEVAMGLETVHPEVLDKLNKRMTLDQFAEAALYLSDHDVGLRVFILVQPPFMVAEDALHWAQRSLDFAFACGAAVATLIPTRGGNGAMERLAELGAFSVPRLITVEAAFEYGLSLDKGRVFVDLWDLEKQVGCPGCHSLRVDRLRAMNLGQKWIDKVSCELCGGTS